jgi:hypothetical protein
MPYYSQIESLLQALSRMSCNSAYLYSTAPRGARLEV